MMSDKTIPQHQVDLVGRLHRPLPVNPVIEQKQRRYYKSVTDNAIQQFKFIKRFIKYSSKPGQEINGQRIGQNIVV